MRAQTGIIGDEPTGTAAVGRDARAAAIVARLGTRSIVLVGMMGAGKTVDGPAGSRAHLGLDFVDSDHRDRGRGRHDDSRRSSRATASPISETARTASSTASSADGPRVVATGGGAFIHPSTRLVDQGLHSFSIVDQGGFRRIDAPRPASRGNRPAAAARLIPEGTLKRLMDERYPIYAEADLTSSCPATGSHDTMVAEMTGRHRGRPRGA